MTNPIYDLSHLRDDLPPLPPWSQQAESQIHWDADQMRAYAAKAVAEERERGAKLRLAAEFAAHELAKERPDIDAAVGVLQAGLTQTRLTPYSVGSNDGLGYNGDKCEQIRRTD